MSEVNKLDFADYMLVLDVTLGIGNSVVADDSDVVLTSHWGYCSEEAAELNTGTDVLMPASGALTVIKNTTDITRSIVFFWNEYPDAPAAPDFGWTAHSYKDDRSYNRLKALFEKDLYITVDGVTYPLGKRVGSDTNDPSNYIVVNGYKCNAETQKLSYILKQTGETKRLYINWK